MPDIILTEKPIKQDYIHSKKTKLAYSLRKGLYAQFTEGGDKRNLTVAQAEKWFEIPVLDTLIKKMREKENGDIEVCPSCGALNAYAWSNANMDSSGRILADDGYADGSQPYTEEDFIFLNAEQDTYHIPASSCFEWTCGKCRAS